MKYAIRFFIPLACLVSAAVSCADDSSVALSEGVSEKTQQAVVVDSMQILQRSKRGQEIIARVEERKKQAEFKLMSRQQEFVTAQKEFEEKRVAMSEKAVREEDRKIARMERDLKNQAADMQAEFQEAVNMAMNELARELRSIVAQEAKKQGWTRVDDLATGQVLYVADAGDVTQEMIQLWDQVLVAERETDSSKGETAVT